MAIYRFQCKKCESVYESLTKWDDSRKFPKVKCPDCNSTRKEMLPSTCAPPVFSNPRGTSKEDSPTYAGDYNLEQAREERRQAESVARNPNPYPEFED